MMYQIVASDLDGTLLNSNHRLSNFTRRVLRALRSQGINFVFATGRHHVDVAQMRQRLGIDAFMITSNGARIHDSKGELVFGKSLPREVVVELVPIAIDNPCIYTHIYRGDDWLINKEDDHSSLFFKESLFSYQLFEPGNFVADDVAKVYFTTINEEFNVQLVHLKNQIECCFGDKVSVTFSTVNCLEVMAGGVSKGLALQYVANLLGFDMDAVIAFGDGMNDYEMLSMVGKGCIMYNASDALKRRLPTLEIIGSNAEEAVPFYLQNLFLR